MSQAPNEKELRRRFLKQTSNIRLTFQDLHDLVYGGEDLSQDRDATEEHTMLIAAMQHELTTRWKEELETEKKYSQQMAALRAQDDELTQLLEAQPELKKLKVYAWHGNLRGRDIELVAAVKSKAQIHELTSLHVWPREVKKALATSHRLAALKQPLTVLYRHPHGNEPWRRAPK